MDNWKTTAVGAAFGVPVAVGSLIEAVASGSIQASWPLVALAALGLGFVVLGYQSTDRK